MRAHASIWYDRHMSKQKRGVLGLFELVGELSRRRYQLGERAFAKLGLNHTEARILSLLVGYSEAPTQDALSSRLTVDRSNAGRAMKGLEQRRLVAREKHVSDGRTYVVRLTDEGRDAARQIEQMRAGMAQELFPQLSNTQADALIAQLEQAFDVGGA